MIRIETLQVAHVARDEQGQKLEPEQMPALQVGHAQVMVNAGVENPNGGPPIVTIQNLAQHIGFKGQSQLATPKIERHTTAGAAAKEATSKCLFCRSFDLEAVQGTKNQFRERNITEMTQQFVRQGYSLPIAQDTALHVGMCSQFDRPAMATHTCARFRAKKEFRRTLGDKLTNIMRAAAGKFDAINFKL
jgi:hypothetical protein